MDLDTLGENTIEPVQDGDPNMEIPSGILPDPKIAEQGDEVDFGSFKYPSDECRDVVPRLREVER